MRTQSTYFQRLDRVIQIVDRTGQGSEMQNHIQITGDIDIGCHIVFDKCKTFMPCEAR